MSTMMTSEAARMTRGRRPMTPVHADQNLPL